MKQENAVVVKLISGQREHSFFTVDRYDYPTGDFEYHIYVSKNTPKTLNRKDMADYWSKENRNKGFSAVCDSVEEAVRVITAQTKKIGREWMEKEAASAA
jgi:hypothetical protein